jgi:uncharacterized protein (DUF302 family)
MSFYLNRTVENSFENVYENIQSLLHKHDYLIAADIDVQGALKQKLNADLSQIRIIGTNTPEVGLKLFSTDPKLGTLLPFSIVLHEQSSEKIDVTFVDPEWLLGSTENPDIIKLASEIK